MSRFWQLEQRVQWTLNMLNITRQNPERLLECGPWEAHDARFLGHDRCEGKEIGRYGVGTTYEKPFFGGGGKLFFRENRSLKLMGNVTSARRLGKRACVVSSEGCLVVKRRK